jgi:hypothetical protein
MKVTLISHVNGDGDILEAWLKYNLHLGITAFHLIVHGTREENSRLYDLKDCFPITIADQYEGAYHCDEQKARLNWLLDKMRGQWVLLADSDEFVELPYRGVGSTIRMLKLAGKSTLPAPMLQRITRDGALDTPALITDPFHFFPLCSVDLYERMGVGAATRKFPLFFCTEQTVLHSGGNHQSPNGDLGTSLQGVTHHFKFRSAVFQRLSNRINSSHPWRHESVEFQEYLEHHSHCVPTEGAFAYSRRELFRRGLLRGYTLMTGIRHFWRSGSMRPRHNS